MKMKLPFYGKEEEKNTKNLTDKGEPSIYDYKSDYEIWVELTRGSENVFNHIYRKYVGSMFNFGAQFTASKEILKDCIQIVFINIRKGKEGVKNMYSIKAYLFKALKREIIKRLEKEKKYADLEAYQAHFFAIEISQEQKIINSELLAEEKTRFKEILNQLTIKQRQGILLYYQEGFSYGEVAEILGLKNSKSARKLLYRALDSAREMAKK